MMANSLLPTAIVILVCLCTGQTSVSALNAASLGMKRNQNFTNEIQHGPNKLGKYSYNECRNDATMHPDIYLYWTQRGASENWNLLCQHKFEISEKCLDILLVEHYHVSEACDQFALSSVVSGWAYESIGLRFSSSVIYEIQFTRRRSIEAENIPGKFACQSTLLVAVVPLCAVFRISTLDNSQYRNSYIIRFKRSNRKIWTSGCKI